MGADKRLIQRLHHPIHIPSCHCWQHRQGEHAGLESRVAGAVHLAITFAEGRLAVKQDAVQPIVRREGSERRIVAVAGLL